jgi:hypothetical protein
VAGEQGFWQKPKPLRGEFGFRLIAIAALFSTASAINGTLLAQSMSVIGSHATANFLGACLA